MIETLIMEWLKKSVVPQARESGGTFFVEYGRPFKAVSIAAWLIAVAVAILCALPSTSIAPQVVLVIPGGFFLLALFLHSEFFLARITYGVAGVDVYSKWGGQRSIAWHEIEGVQLSKASQDYVVQLNGGSTFKFSYFMSGHASLLEEMRRHAKAA